MAKVVIIGGGAMGGAIATGLAGAGWDDVHVVEANPARREELAAVSGLAVTDDLSAVVAGADAVAVVVKPKDVDATLDVLAPQLPAGAVVCSMAAGMTLDHLAAHLPAGTGIVRVMPNTPARVGFGMAALSPNQHVTADQLELATQIMAGVGKAVVVAEKLQDAVTAVSGSGPAYLFYIAESMIDAGVQLGLPREVASTLTRQTILGAAKLLETGEHPTVLRENVTSPGGTTAAAIAEFDAHAVKAGIAAGMRACHDASAK